MQGILHYLLLGLVITKTMAAPVYTADRNYLAVFARNFTSYCKAREINMASVFRAVQANRGIRMNIFKLAHFRLNTFPYPVPVYVLSVLCEEIGLSLSDFAPLQIPDKEPIGIDPIHLKKRKKG